MFFENNYFRQYNDEKEITDYKSFYKKFSNEREFGGDYSHWDHIVLNRFLHTFGYMFDAVLRKMPKNILDIGCGNGQNLPLSRIFKDIKYHGVDYAEKTLEVARKNFPNINFQQMDAFNLMFEPESFEMVIMSLLLIIYKEEKDQLQLLGEVRKVLSQNGVFLLVVRDESFFVKNSIRLSETIARLKGIKVPKDFNAAHFSHKDIKNLVLS